MKRLKHVPMVVLCIGEKDPVMDAVQLKVISCRC